MKRKNYLLTASEHRYGAPAFDKIKEDDYLPAFKEALQEAKNEVDAIINDPNKPTFQNTVEALEFSGEKLDSICSIFFNLNECMASDKMQKIAETISPLLTEFSLYILLNDKLFQRIKFIWNRKGKLHLGTEAARLLEKKYKAFVENGARLSPSSKKELSQLLRRIDVLSLKYGKNVLDATNGFILHITEKQDLEGLPDYVIEAAGQEARERKKKGWVFTLQAPSMLPFMKYSSRRDLREKIWRAYNTRCIGGQYDNTLIMREILMLRLRIANILGYKTYASYALRNRMAGKPSTVNRFLNGLLKASLPYGKRDIQQLEKLAGTTIAPWDFAYWAEKLRTKRFALDEAQLKPYFRLENVQKALFLLAEKLYGIKFKPAKDIPVYHRDVTVYDVRDYDGTHLALLYMDFYPRASKRGGAWMTNFREQGYDKYGNEHRPLISIVCNFTKPTSTTPSLLTFSEVETVLHEFGHALNGIVAKGRYSSLTGTNVVRDFVELPSQILENWATQKEFLSLWAKHYKTGEVIPDSLINKIIRSRNFNSGYASVRQLRFGITDMALHSLTEQAAKANHKDSSVIKGKKKGCDSFVIEIEKEVGKRCKLFNYKPSQKEDATAFTPAFSHIFAGGYSAGYYSYKWAEVLEADAFELFKRKGIFNKEVAGSFRKNILERGNIEDANILYKRFRGRDPKPQALMRKLGMTR